MFAFYMLILVSFPGFADEHEGTQKKTFTKWINAQLAKVIRSLIQNLIFGAILICCLQTIFHFVLVD